ncbi:MAG: GTPase (G3E family) [Oscillospiraceae bacterium]|nr:GTPase (G3E family) [Oscillospiraceae bacterium]
MKKFCVVSGFLGAGKTTGMMTMTRLYNEKYGKATMISNDIAAKGLADMQYANACGVVSTELTGECICYQTENLVDRLRRLFDYEKNELVMSDHPGFGVGALDHVYHKLAREYPGEFELAPFVVFTEPERLKLLTEPETDLHLPEELRYVLRTQLLECDVAVLNKIDTLSEEETQRYVDFLKAQAPHAQVFPISALEGTGLDALVCWLRDHDASMRNPDIQYGGEEFCAAMSKISQYDIQFYTKVCCNTFDGDAYLSALAQKIQDLLGMNGQNSPHLKLFAITEAGDFAKQDLLGIDYPVEVNHRFSAPVTDMSVVINTSSVCEEKLLGEIIDSAIQMVSADFNCETQVYYRECFGAMAAGRL